MATRKGTITWFAMMIGRVFVEALRWARFRGDIQFKDTIHKLVVAERSGGERGSCALVIRVMQFIPEFNRILYVFVTK